jgi:hypothetical protein
LDFVCVLLSGFCRNRSRYFCCPVLTKPETTLPSAASDPDVGLVAAAYGGPGESTGDWTAVLLWILSLKYWTLWAANSNFFLSDLGRIAAPVNLTLLLSSFLDGAESNDC